MNVTITSRSHPLSEQLKDFAEERIGRLNDHLAQEGSGHLVLNQVRHLHTAELVIRVNGAVITARANDPDIRKTIEEVVDKARKQVDKFRERRMER